MEAGLPPEEPPVFEDSAEGACVLEGLGGAIITFSSVGNDVL